MDNSFDFNNKLGIQGMPKPKTNWYFVNVYDFPDDEEGIDNRPEPNMSTMTVNANDPVFARQTMP